MNGIAKFRFLFEIGAGTEAMRGIINAAYNSSKLKSGVAKIKFFCYIRKRFYIESRSDTTFHCIISMTVCSAIMIKIVRIIRYI